MCSLKAVIFVLQVGSGAREFAEMYQRENGRITFRFDANGWKPTGTVNADTLEVRYDAWTSLADFRRYEQTHSIASAMPPARPGRSAIHGRCGAALFRWCRHAATSPISTNPPHTTFRLTTSRKGAAVIPLVISKNAFVSGWYHQCARWHAMARPCRGRTDAELRITFNKASVIRPAQERAEGAGRVSSRTLATAVIVFQFRVVTGTPKSRSKVPR